MKKTMKWSVMLLAGLLLWPAGAAADESDEEFENRVDPTHVFPPVDRTKYSGNMSMMAVVKKDGTTLGEGAIVAVFAGDEIRGKERTYADQDNMAFVTIYGESSVALTFKVYWDGIVYDCSGSVTFAADGFIGEAEAPYELDLSPVSLADNADNTETLTTWNAKKHDVVLTDRTLYKDGKWNTLCLPFNVTIADSPLAGATARPLSTASITETTLNLTFGDAVTTLTAGTPYIIKWDSGTDITAPTFTGVTIDNTDHSYDNGETGDNRVRFIGTYGNTTFTGTDNSILLLGGDNTLRYPTTNATIGACRAYFKLGDGTALAHQLTTFNIDFGNGETTNIKTTNFTDCTDSDRWYMLDGRRIANGQKPTAKGMYIMNGKKVVIK